jgi:glycine/D-amino acid oxidase-like deaminating enzyme
LQTIERQPRDGAPGFTLNTSRGVIWARNVLVGTSGYTGAATPALRKKIIPIGSFIITTEVLSDKLARELSPRNRQIYDSKNFLFYYRLTPDYRMLFGGRAAFFPETDRSLSATARNEGRIRVGRHTRFLF